MGKATKPCARHEESTCRHHDCGHYIPLEGGLLCCKPGQMLEKEPLKPWIRAREHVSKVRRECTTILGNLRTTTKFTTTTSVEWEKTGTRTSVSAGKRKVKMRSVGRSTTTTLNVNTDVKL